MGLGGNGVGPSQPLEFGGPLRVWVSTKGLGVH